MYVTGLTVSLDSWVYNPKHFTPTALALYFPKYVLWSSSLLTGDEHRKAKLVAALYVQDVVRMTRYKKMWISKGVFRLQLRIYIIGHTNATHHPPRWATKDHYRESFMAEHFGIPYHFFKYCLQCYFKINGEPIYCPFALAVHGTSPNDQLQVYYINLKRLLERTGDTNLVILRANHRKDTLLYLCPTPDTKYAGYAILKWSAAFCAPSGSKFDGVGHFKMKPCIR